MIRVLQKIRVLLLVAILGLVVSSVLLDSDVARAGDADGLQGYRMKLKKEFTWEHDPGSSGQQLVAGTADQSKRAIARPQLATTVHRDPVSASRFNAFLVWILMSLK